LPQRASSADEFLRRGSVASGAPRLDGTGFQNSISQSRAHGHAFINRH